MTKLFTIKESEHGVEVKIAKDHCCGGNSFIQELLTVEEAESLATDLLNAAMSIRHDREYGPDEPDMDGIESCPECGKEMETYLTLCEKCWRKKK